MDESERELRMGDPVPTWKIVYPTCPKCAVKAAEIARLKRCNDGLLRGRGSLRRERDKARAERNDATASYLALVGSPRHYQTGGVCPEEPIPEPEPSLFVCPGCGGYADNGFSRDEPPAPYFCTRCMEKDEDGSPPDRSETHRDCSESDRDTIANMRETVFDDELPIEARIVAWETAISAAGRL